MIHDDGTIDAWFAAPGGQYGDNVLLYENKGQNTPVRLGAAGSSVSDSQPTGRSTPPGRSV